MPKIIQKFFLFSASTVFAFALPQQTWATNTNSDAGFWPGKHDYLHVFPEGNARDFATAVWNGDIDGALLKAKSLPKGVNTVGGNCHTALEIAAYRHDLNMAKALVKAGANPNGEPHCSPLVMAMHDGETNGFSEFATFLVKSGAQVDSKYQNHRAIDSATIHGDQKVIRTLIDLHTNINEPSSKLINDYPILTMAQMGYWTSVEYAIQHGANIWVTGQFGDTVGSEALSNLNPDQFNKAYIYTDASPEKMEQEHQALLRVIQYLKESHYPWPSPSPEAIKKMVKEGKWPPKETK
ncbi:ankyrin repeat domain-containing protein [Swingsia samuiensis]|uniref:Ankyrin repeat domain-containing protein n=1 Tax=Swingsia samuiensis TaxID=1293412 RepID=A0A4Y6UHP6_9PROT|nr:ankyrin repeat domain-containing protein [Swingsia samuiensis]QDH16340.1 ankyrin repeat domain-containing protein [Swingsia samuiensis]